MEFCDSDVSEVYSVQVSVTEGKYSSIVDVISDHLKVRSFLSQIASGLTMKDHL